MSYKTNPIANRIKINKGWKSPYLPIKTLNYARDISLWFKVYLLLKVFLNLKKIQLVCWEIRFDQQNKKILYLRINKKGIRRKKRKKKKTVLNKILKKSKTPLLKNSNTGSIFFLYQDLVGLKKLSFWSKNTGHKKNLTQFWLTKPKLSTWMNTFEKLMFVRQNVKKAMPFSKKNKTFIPTPHIKLKFYKKKQNKILAQIFRIKKKNLILQLKFFELFQQKKIKNLRKIIQNFKKQLFENRIQIQKLNEISKVLLYSLQKDFVKKKITKSKKNSLIDAVQKKKLKFLWRILTKKFNSFGRTRFFRPKLPTVLLHLKKNLLKNPSNISWKLLKKNTSLKKILHLNFLVAQTLEKDILIKNYFLFLNWNLKFRFCVNTCSNKKLLFQNRKGKAFLKAKFYQKKKKAFLKQKMTSKLFYNITLWLFLRKIKKKKRFQFWVIRKKFRRLGRKFKVNLKLKSYTKYNNFLEKEKFFQTENKNQIVNQIKKINRAFKHNRIAKYYKYRLPYRRIHLNFKQLDVSLKLKYLIQDFVQKYFQVQIEAKIEHVFNAHKNKNFFRLIFPVRKKKRTQLIKKHRLDTWNQKQIFLASRLKLAITAKSKKKNKKNKFAPLNLKQELTKTNPMRILKKKEFFILAEKKRLKWGMSNYFSRVKRAKDFKQIFKYSMPTLMEFSRSFEPQLLADILAKVILKAKKQTKMLNNIKRILQAIQLPKNVGYKIVLTGRINSKKKSRSIYITRKQITLQIFDTNMNYAYAQANARIGAFGIKIWVYSKKNLKNEKNNSTTSKYQI